MGRFGQPRYKDPVGTPAALRGIREVTDKNKHILLEGIFNGDFIPDHLLPVGIHRCGQQRWRAHLCTVGLKFSGPPRDTVRDACEDRRKFCEENGVNFVLYGKQTHAKGPIGSRPIIPSTFPRLSDYVTSLSRASAGGSGNSQAILSSLRSNGSLRPFFEAIENTKRIITAKVAEGSGDASYVVTKSHAALHRKIVEDTIDRPIHAFSTMRVNNREFSTPFRLCPVSVEIEGIYIKFIWNIDSSLTDGTLFSYLESVLGNNVSDFRDGQRQNIQQVIDKDVSPQIGQLAKINEIYNQLIRQHANILNGIRFIHQHTPHVVHTRKAHATPIPVAVSDPQDSWIEIVLGNGTSFKWDVFTPDDIAIDFARDLENWDQSINADDALFSILNRSMKHRSALLQLQPHIMKKAQAVKTGIADESHSKFSDDDMQGMNDAYYTSLDEHLLECINQVNKL